MKPYDRNKIHFALILCCAVVQLAIAQSGVSRIIPTEETKKLKAIRNEIGSIKNLDTLYEDRKHKNGLPYHFYIPKHLKAGVKYPMVIFLHGYTDLTIDTHKGFPKGVWSLPKIQKEHSHILFVPRNRKKQDNWSSDEYRTMTIDALDDLVAELNGNPKTPNVDVDRLYLTGFSRGGQGTWNFIRTFPNKFAAAAHYPVPPMARKMPKKQNPSSTSPFGSSTEMGIEGSKAHALVSKHSRKQVPPT